MCLWKGDEDACMLTSLSLCVCQSTKSETMRWRHSFSDFCCIVQSSHMLCCTSMHCAGTCRFLMCVLCPTHHAMLPTSLIKSKQIPLFWFSYKPGPRPALCTLKMLCTAPQS